MKKSCAFGIMILAFAYMPVSATIINIPDDYLTIQQGIDASSDGDTVLVQPGTYVENINFNGHNIVLGSLFLTTEDTSYISETIIDGDSSGSVVTFENGEDSTSIIAGFSIQNGALTQGGGIHCSNASPTIIDNIIKENSSPWEGGGIYCEESDPNIINNIIYDNFAGSGGGIGCVASSPRVTFNTISGNSSVFGGGIRGYYSDPVITNCIIYGNYPNEIHDQATINYSDIRGGWPGEGNIDALPLFVDPQNSDYNLCIQSPCIDAGDPNMEDPDGTRADMGHFFPTHPECSIGNILYVSTDGDDESGDGSHSNPFRTIQHAIDVSVYCDTIIAENGLYAENVDFLGKTILLGSNFVFSSDTTDILTTIIDGDSSGTVVKFENYEDTSSVLIGLTIKNGYANFGGGIICDSSSPSINHNIITQNSSTYEGAGIYCYAASPLIRENTIVENSSSRSGGGISCNFNSFPNVDDNTISGNSAAWAGGGIHYSNSSPVLINNIISLNSAIMGGGFGGGGLHPYIEGNSVIENHTFNGGGYPGKGGGLFIQNSSPTIRSNTINDNSSSSSGGGIFFDGSNPDLSNNSIIGNVALSGGGICFATSHSENTVNNIINENRAIRGGGIFLGGSQAFLSGNVINLNTADIEGGGIYCDGSNPILRDNRVNYNQAGSGGGIFFNGSAPVLQNSILCGNSASIAGGGIYCYAFSNPSLNNNVIRENSADSAGGGIHCAMYSNPTLSNSICWSNNAPIGWEVYTDSTSSITITYSDIQGGWEGEGNMDADPLFRDPENGDYHLMFTECGDPYDSPCIDAGSPAIIDSLLDCSWGLGSIASDMGAYGGGDSVQVGIDDQTPEVPGRFALAQNYPNPFNASTIIRYSLLSPSDVIIEIYDILGRRVETLVQGEQPAGYHQIAWDASNHSSGMYFYRIQAGEYSETKKMVLLK